MSVATPTISAQMPLSAGRQERVTSWLVIGMGSFAYGKERRAVTALKHMPRIQAHFLTTIWEDGSVSDLLRRNNFEFTPATVGYLGRAHPGWTLKNIVLMPLLFVKALRIYREKRCCGVLVLALQAFANLLPALWLLKVVSRAKLVFYLGDIPANSRTNRVLCRIMDSMADAIVVNSEAVREGLANVGVNSLSIRVVYNGVELERFSAAQPFRWREQFGWNRDTVIVGFAGQFRESKGIWDFVEAAEQVLERDDHCRFVLIGRIDNENACYRDLVARLQNRGLDKKIVFTGWISEMESAYAALDMIVVPSRHEEPAANVVIEAIAGGVPIIATRVGGSPELVSDKESGFLVEKANPAEIAKKVLEFASDEPVRRQFGLAGRRIARERFDASKNACLVQESMLQGR